MKTLSKCLIAAVTALLSTSTISAAFIGERSDFRDETIYFAITTRFYDGDPKNNVLCWDGVSNQTANNDPAWRGDFKGLIEKLDYIKALGFTAIWITPVVQNGSGFDYHGYHAMDFSKVDLRYESRKEWGSQEDVKFQDLIDAAHAKGLKIILDVVLQHTGNFGENYFCKLFDRSQDIRNQANITAALIPDQDKLGGQEYWNLPNSGSKTQYSERFKYIKNTDGQNHDSKNYWHHLGTQWNWDEPSRWWGQIAGDCVDLNTENPAVIDYIVECYGKFIEMGVDGFRIDTTGHIAPLTFNAGFIPRFIELGEKYKSKRLNEAPFYMFGECCSRFGNVIYRGQHVLSSHYYTWKSDPALVAEWNAYTSDWWAQQNVAEGAEPLGNMLTCLKDAGTVHDSNNALMVGGAWHEPDYSQASGFNVIDFPMHYNYTDAGNAVRIAKEGDKYYNDASWNVVYVDSHDYAPQPNDNKRFDKGTAQWAENLSMMFTFRGIPCLYYGSEVEFKKGCTIDEGPALALINSGRAYFGEYLKGNVTASDFGEYTAEGNVAKTLNGDLSQHIIRLNQIRSAVPALRKGQYTFDGCTANGGWAFKRAYKDSYALVSVNGGATFTNVPAGNYTDLVTGKTYTGGGSITVDAPKGKGQLRVLVKDWEGGKVGVDGMFIYETSPVNHGGSVSFTDPGTTEYYTYDDAIGAPSVTFSPAGGSFKTETLTVTVALNEAAVSGWFEVEGKTRETLEPGRAKTFTIGADMAFGQSVNVKWGAVSPTAESYEGKVAYKKVDPNATISVYVTGKDNINISSANLYAWSGGNTTILGAWPGKNLAKLESVNLGGRDFYVATFDDLESVNVILNNGGVQTADITNITEDTFFEYDGKTEYKKIDVVLTKSPVVTFSPGGGEFVDKVTVTANLRNADSGWYKIGNGPKTDIGAGATVFTIGENMAIGESVTVSWGATSATESAVGEVTYTKVEAPKGITIYYDNTVTKWSNVMVHHFDTDASSWPGKKMSFLSDQIYTYVVPIGTRGLVFNNGSGEQTVDVLNVIDNHVYKSTKKDGNWKIEDCGVYQNSGIESISAPDATDAPIEYYNLQGVRVVNPTPGIYIQRQGNKVRKIII